MIDYTDLPVTADQGSSSINFLSNAEMREAQDTFLSNNIYGEDDVECDVEPIDMMHAMSMSEILLEQMTNRDYAKMTLEQILAL